MAEICYIVNPAADEGSGESIARTLRQQLGANCVKTTQTVEHASELALEAVDEGFGTIVAVGGDGMIHHVIRGLAPRFPVFLGLLSAGTGNDFIRNFSYPDWLKIGVTPYHEMLKNNRVRWTDLIRIETPDQILYGCTQFTFGFSGEIVAIVSLMDERSPGMYLRTGFIHARKARPIKLAGDFEGDIFDVYVTNTPTIAGGLRIAPRARVDDGKLETLVIPKRAIPTRYLLLGIARLGLIRSKLSRLLGVAPGEFEDFVEYETFEPLHAQIDGEHYRLPAGKIRISVLPRTLGVIAPS